MADELYCWPSWMPVAQRPNYAYEPTDRRSKTEMEVGSVLRVNFDTDESTLDCTLILNSLQAQWFEKFERDWLNQGAKWFQMPIQIAGCIEWHTVRFAARPKAGNLIGPRYTTYTLKLDIQKRDLKLCDEVVDLMLCVSPAHLRLSSANARNFWMSLQKLKDPAWLLYFICPYLDGFLLCISEEELCQSSEYLRQSMQQIIPSFNMPPFWNPQAS